MNNLKRRFKLILSSKLAVLFISLASLLGTLLFVSFIKSYEAHPDLEADYAAYEALINEAMKGKTAVSVNIPMAFLPLELLYPGVNVDITDTSREDIRYLARNVTILGLSTIGTGALARLTLAVSPSQGEDILNAKQDSIGLLVKGENSSDIDEIEIVEF